MTGVMLAAMAGVMGVLIAVLVVVVVRPMLHGGVVMLLRFGHVEAFLSVLCSSYTGYPYGATGFRRTTLVPCSARLGWRPMSRSDD
ncbi:hypothetical protein GCM10022380_80760 [Amycolatopsis tucumanensis]|uniref:Uncharacterized protein n=1 Tax=Amycolatopsis tucumanensis TaxID=401106 RepID=A0ABP7JQ80_9PSEU